MGGKTIGHLVSIDGSLFVCESVGDKMIVYWVWIVETDNGSAMVWKFNRRFEYFVSVTKDCQCDVLLVLD